MSSLKNLREAVALLKQADQMPTNVDEAEPKTIHLEPPPEEVQPEPSVATSDRTAWDEFVQDGPKMLNRAFDGFLESARADKAFMGQYFGTKEYESHSPLLRKYEREGLAPSAYTLAEKSKKVLG
jgi:hypothetical protein